MSQQELLALVSTTCERLGLEYFITGSWSSSYQGEPRATHDLDLVVQLSRRNIRPLLDAFSDERFYLSSDSIEQAIQHNSMFNLLDSYSGDKVDFWLLTDEPWDQKRFERRMKTQIMGIETFVSSPEDTILAKLRWAKLSGGSEKQMNDARGILAVQAQQLDFEYIVRWANQLEVSELWESINGDRGQHDTNEQ